MSNFIHRLRHWAKACPEKIALQVDEKRYTYAELPAAASLFKKRIPRTSACFFWRHAKPVYARSFATPICRRKMFETLPSQMVSAFSTVPSAHLT